MVEAHSDGTITFAGKQMDGPEVAKIATGILAAMIEATRKAGQVDAAKESRSGELIHAVRPSMVRLQTVQQGDEPLLVLVCGHAHVGVAIPMPVLTELARGILAYSADDRTPN